MQGTRKGWRRELRSSSRFNISKQLFSCKDAAQQVLMSVCLSEFNVEILSQCANLYSSRMFQAIPECFRMHAEYFRMHAECSRMHAECS